MALGVGVESQAGLLDRAGLADAGQHVLQGPPLGAVVEDVIGGDHRRAVGLGHGRQLRQPVQVARAVATGRRQPDVAPQGPGDGPQLILERGLEMVRRHDEDHLALGVVQEVRPTQLALRLPGAPLADGQQPRQPAIGLTVGGIDQQAGRPVGEIQAAAGQVADRRAGLRQVALRPPGPRRSGQRIAVADPDGLQAQRIGADHQLVRMRRAAQEREVAGGLQLHIAGHPNTPCIHHWGGACGSP